MQARAHVVFWGKVQGVFFRANCRRNALEMRLTGFVNNLHDGSVEVVYEGEKDDIARAIEWNRASQPKADVHEVEVTWATPTGEFKTFEIR